MLITGKCAKRDAGACPYRHDRETLPMSCGELICKFFLSEYLPPNLKPLIEQMPHLQAWRKDKPSGATESSGRLPSRGAAPTTPQMRTTPAGSTARVLQRGEELHDDGEVVRSLGKQPFTSAWLEAEAEA